MTGNRVWRLALPRGRFMFEGGAHPADGREDLAAFGLDCREDGKRRSHWLAVDPAKGTVRWDEARLKESPEVSMLDGVTLASDGTALRAFGEDGDQFGVWRGDGVRRPDVPGRADAGAARGRLPPGRVRRHPDGGGGRAVRAGRLAPRRPRVRGARAGRRHVFALRPRLSEGLLLGVDIVEPGDGSATTAPAPFSMDPDMTGARPWLAAAGGLLYAAVPQAAPRPDGAARLVALRGGHRDGPGRTRRRPRGGLAGRVLAAHQARPGRGADGRLRHGTEPRVATGETAAPGLVHVRTARQAEEGPERKRPKPSPQGRRNRRRACPRTPIRLCGSP